jgi:hypothetical protein
MTLHLSQESIDKCLPSIKSYADYQIRFLIGYQRLSGGDLKGKAKRYGMSYKNSRNKVLNIVEELGINFLRTIGPNGLLEVWELGIKIPKNRSIVGLTKDDMKILQNAIQENNPSILFLGEYSSKISKNIFRMFLEDFELTKAMIKF